MIYILQTKELDNFSSEGGRNAFVLIMLISL